MNLFGKPTLAGITADLRDKVAQLEGFSTLTVDEAAEKRIEADKLHEDARALEADAAQATRIAGKIKDLLA